MLGKIIAEPDVALTYFQLYLDFIVGFLLSAKSSDSLPVNFNGKGMNWLRCLMIIGASEYNQAKVYCHKLSRSGASSKKMAIKSATPNSPLI